MMRDTIRNSACMHSSNGQFFPRRICSSAIRQAGRRFCANGGGGLRRPFGVGAARLCFAIKCRENILDARTREQPVDRTAAVSSLRRSVDGLGEGRENGIDRYIAAKRLGQLGKTRGAHVMAGDTAATPSAVFRRSPVSAQ